MSGSIVAAADQATGAASGGLEAAAVRIEAVDALVGPGRGRTVTLASPKPGSASELFAIDFRGSVAAGHAISSVQLAVHGELLAETPVDIEQPHGELGFRTRIGAFRLPPHFSIEVRAVGDNGAAVPIAIVSGSRASLGPSESERLLSPVLVTTPTGRTGTTWLVYLLGLHPSLIAYPPFRVEPRLASYWLEAMGSLAEPASYLQSLRPRMENPHWFLGGWPKAARAQLNDPEMARFLGRDAVERFAAFARERVEAFYRLAARQQKKRPRAFVEKGPFGRVRLEAIEDLFGSVRELTLFRDPRDTICSILAYQQVRPDATLVINSLDAGRQSMVEIADGIAGMLEQTQQRGDRALRIRYEDLVQRPQPTLRQAFAHLGIADDEATAERVCALAAEGDPGKVHRTSPDPASSVGRWRRDLDPQLGAIASEVFKDVLAELGYDPGLDGKAGARSGAAPVTDEKAHGIDPPRTVRILAALRSETAWLSRILGGLPGVAVAEPPHGSDAPASPGAPARSAAVLLAPDRGDSVPTDDTGLEAARRAYDSHTGPKAMIDPERLRYAPLDTLREVSRSLELPVTDLDLAGAVIHHDRELPAEAMDSGQDSQYREPADG